MPPGHEGCLRSKQLVLVDRHPTLRRDIAAPLVIPGNAVGYTRLDILEEVATHQVPAVVRLAETLESTVAEGHRLQQVEQCLPLLWRGDAATRCRQIRPQLDAGDNGGEHCEDNHAGGDEPRLTWGHTDPHRIVRTLGLDTGVRNRRAAPARADTGGRRRG